MSAYADLGNLVPALGGASGLSDFMGWLASNFDPSITWRDVEWIRQHWAGPLIIKGTLNPDDARSAVASGEDGIVVTNHGGRQLDGAASTISALPKIADAVGSDCTVNRHAAGVRRPGTAPAETTIYDGVAVGV